MTKPLLIVFIAGASLTAALRIHMAGTEERFATLEERVTTLERTVDACCSTTHGLLPEEEDAHRAYVALKKRVYELEKRVKELEGEK